MSEDFDDLAANPPAETAVAAALPSRNLLRPDQVAERSEDLRQLEEMVSAPSFVSSRVDVSLARRRAAGIKRELEAHAPRRYEGRELDRAVVAEKRLREKITSEMQSQEVMRRNPPGAATALIAFNERNKKDIAKWKNIRLRLNESGALRSGEPVANLETFRPRHKGGARDIDDVGTQIPGKSFYLPSSISVGNIASDEDKARWRSETVAALSAVAAGGDARAANALKALLEGDEAEVEPAPTLPLRKAVKA